LRAEHRDLRTRQTGWEADGLPYLPHQTLERSIETDVIIVGAGVSAHSRLMVSADSIVIAQSLRPAVELATDPVGEENAASAIASLLRLGCVNSCAAERRSSAVIHRFAGSANRH
jgi:hypothetical protein